MRNFHLILLGALTLVFILLLETGMAETGEQEQQLLQLQQSYRHLKSLSFDFDQLTRTGIRSRAGSGNAVFLRTPDPAIPGIMRWNYKKPDPQVILNDGKKLSIYTEKDHQLIITSASELNSDITYAFFSGRRDISDDFIAVAPDNRFGFTLADTPLHALRLLPRISHPQIKAIQLWYDNNFLLHRLVLEDHFDSITELTFTNIKTDTMDNADKKQRENLLDLDLPPDTEIITQ